MEVHDVIVSGVLFEVISGAALTLLCFVLAGFLAEVLNTPGASTFISIMSISIFGGAIVSAVSSIFVGFERMKLNSFTVVSQALAKTVVGLLLVFLGYGVLGAIVGVVTSYFAGGIIGITAVYFFLFKSLGKFKAGAVNFVGTLRPMLKFGCPLMVSNIVIGVLPLLLNSLIVIYAGASMFGNYSVALNFAVLLTFVTVPINTVLFPTFSKVDADNDSSLMRTVFASSVKYTAILLVPATLAIMALSTPMVNTLFGYVSGVPKYAFAPFFLVLYVANNLLVVFGSISAGNFLAGIGKTKVLMFQGLLTLGVGLPLAFLLIPPFGVVGGIVAGTLASVFSLAFGLYWIWNRYKVKAEFGVSAKILLASLLASIFGYLSSNTFNIADWLNLTLGFVVFSITYLVSAPLVGAIKQTDINNLRSMFSGLGAVSKVAEIPLKFMEKTLKILYNEDIVKNQIGIK